MMFPAAVAPAARLPKDAAVVDPNPEWAEVHRVVKQIVSKKFASSTLNATSYLNYRVTTACDIEFISLIEPKSLTADVLTGELCPLCWKADAMGSAA